MTRQRKGDITVLELDFRNKNIKINIVGFGRITLALIKRLLNDELIECVDKITIWCREGYILDNNSIVSVNDKVYESILYMHMRYAERYETDILSKIEIKYYHELSELSQISINSDENDILFLATKYNLNEFTYIDKECTQNYDFANNMHRQLFFMRCKQSFGENMCDRFNNDAKRINKFIHNYRINIKKALDELEYETHIKMERLYNLENSILPIVFLAPKLCGFKGTVFNMVNEVDIINAVLMDYSDLPYYRICSPCENDKIRSYYFMQKAFEAKGINVEKIELNYYGPHNTNGFIDEESLRINGKELSQYFTNTEIRDLLYKVSEEVNQFGEKIFLKKGSSDEDTVDGIYMAFKSFFSSIRGKKGAEIRASAYHLEDKLFYGNEILFNSRGEVIVKNSNYELSKLKTALEEQNILMKKIRLSLYEISQIFQLEKRCE